MTNSKKLKKLITLDINEFNNMLSNSGSILGLDLGEKRIGMAISDNNRSFAISLKNIQRGKLIEDINFMKNIISDNDISALIIGRPVNLDGKPGRKSQSIRRLAEEINKTLALPLLLWDERYSSQAVEKIMINELDLSRSKRKNLIDSSSACWILEGALKRIKNI
jgi:putative holliday junction resolvase